MSAERVIALLGRRDEPTDAVEEYCNLLGAALAEHSFHVEVRRVPWREHGWPAALDALRLQADAWRGTWVLVQYTSLAWSSRGFPTRFLRVLRVLRKAGCRIAVVFHDAEPFGGTRLVDRVRRAAQLHVMRSAVAFADRSILTVPVARLGWVHGAPDNAFFIPVGANLPQPLLEQDHDELHDPATVAVYGVTGGSPGDWETRLIASSVREAATKLGKLRLVVFGRYAEARRDQLSSSLGGSRVEVCVEGVMEGDSLVERFSSADVLLFLRGTISSRRGSAIAGIACGLPVIALRGHDTDSPVTDAGVVLLDIGADIDVLAAQCADALVEVLSNGGFRRELTFRSRRAHEQSFAWPAIARSYNEALRKSLPCDPR